MKTIIAGSRFGLNREDINQAIKDCGWEITEVVSGGAQGVDRMGEKWARENGKPLVIMRAEWNKYGVKAGLIRNTEMAKVSQALVAVWDGQSTGTAHMISEARRLGLKVHVYVRKTGLGYPDE